MENLKTINNSVSASSRFLGRTYGWMAFALLISSVVAYFTSLFMFVPTSDGRLALSTFGALLFGNRGMGFIILSILEIVVVIFLSAKIRTISVGAAVFSFIFYALLNGLTLSSIFTVYDIASVANAFLATSLTFFVMSIYGSKTKSNLAKAGKYLMMGLIGIILASVLHFVIAFFTKAPLKMLDLLISIATVVIFTGLTAYDSQKVLAISKSASDSDAYKKIAIIAALELYLDFINILLALLKLFGRRRDD